jgi:hypothetical protein
VWRGAARASTPQEPDRRGLEAEQTIGNEVYL